jgi:hypothetical protein
VEKLTKYVSFVHVRSTANTDSYRDPRIFHHFNIYLYIFNINEVRGNESW